MMKTRNIFIGTIALLSAILLSSFIQGGQYDLRGVFRKSPEARAQMVTTVMKNKLDMDDKQADKAFQVNLKYAKLGQPYLKVEAEPMENTAELLALNQKRSAELKTILTPEQIQQVETIRKEWIDRMETILAHLKENDF
jgi:hypothetical protein